MYNSSTSEPVSELVLVLAAVLLVLLLPADGELSVLYWLGARLGALKRRNQDETAHPSTINSYD